MLTKVITVSGCVALSIIVILLPIENYNYLSKYGNTYLVTNPVNFCKESSSDKIYYVTSVNGGYAVGYVVPIEYITCSDDGYLMRGKFKDFQGDSHCEGFLYAFVSSDFILANFSASYEDSFCTSEMLILKKRIKLYEKLFYFL